MLRISVKQLAEEYLSLTGRPAATLSVEEYTHLYRLVFETGGAGDTISTSEDNSFIPSPVNNNIYPLPGSKQEENKQITKTGVEKTDTVPTKESKLSILRSVSG